MMGGGCNACEPNLIVGMGCEEACITSRRAVRSVVLIFQATFVTFLLLSFLHFGWSVPYFL
jgi:hypothetical protein